MLEVDDDVHPGFLRGILDAVQEFPGVQVIQRSLQVDKQRHGRVVAPALDVQEQLVRLRGHLDLVQGVRNERGGVPSRAVSLASS